MRRCAALHCARKQRGQLLLCNRRNHSIRSTHGRTCTRTRTHTRTRTRTRTRGRVVSRLVLLLQHPRVHSLPSLLQLRIVCGVVVQQPIDHQQCTAACFTTCCRSTTCCGSTTCTYSTASQTARRYPRLLFRSVSFLPPRRGPRSRLHRLNRSQI
jgi:hypothetical protein